MSIYKGSTLIAGKVIPGGGGTDYTILTAAEYAALSVKDPDMLYVVKLTNNKITLYLGTLPLDTGAGQPYMVPTAGTATFEVIE